MSAVVAPVVVPVDGEVGGPKSEVAEQEADVATQQPEAGGEPMAKDGSDDAEVADRSEAGTRGVPATEDAQERHKAEASARMRESSAPAALKAGMIRVAEAAQDAATVEACLKAVEEALPEFLRGSSEASARREHPSGEIFFRANPEELSDEEAEEIAQRQLARSGLLRGQRVRVAD